MASPLPAPLAAAIGLVPTALDGARRLPGRIVQLPFTVVTQAVASFEQAQRSYEELTQRGEDLVLRLRGGADDLAERADALEDRVEDLVARTPFATAYDRAEDVLEDAGEGLRGAAGKATRTLGDSASRAEQVAQRAADAVAPEDEPQDLPAAEQPKGAPTPRAVEPDSTRVGTAATAAVEQVVEDVAAAATGDEVPEHDALPLPDYDHMTLGSLRGRLRSLSVGQLVTLRSYEKAHADRLPVVTMLDNRIAKLSADAAAAPSGAVSTAPSPEQQESAKAPRGRSKASAATSAPPAGPSVDTGPSRPLN